MGYRFRLKPSTRTGPELILATKPYAFDNPARSWGHILLTTFLLAIAFAGTIWNFAFWPKIACSVLAGLLLLRMFVIYHDQQHHAILAKSTLAKAFMRVFGIVALSPSSIWRSSHNHHHSHNSQLRGSHIGSFPIMTRKQYEISSPSERLRYLAMRHPLTILGGYLSMFSLGMCVVPFLNSPARHWDCLVALVVHLAIGAVLFFVGGVEQLLLAQTTPYIVGCAIGCYLFYAQHNFPGVSFAERAGWTYEKAALESSSHLRTGPLMQWFTANIGYHHIHHLNSKVPFYRLPELMRDIPELQNPRTTSLHPMEIARCLRLKVWDTELQRMIGLREFA